jgi:excisionase family DNA binding protein
MTDAWLSSARLMTAAEVSELLRVPRSTVYELARTRRIPFLKVGRRTLFDPQLLREWIAGQTVRPRA